MIWNEFLQANGAQLKNGEVINFGHAEAESKMALHGNIMTDLSHLAIIEVTGRDAEDFLHGQFTNDLKKLDVNKLQCSAWCNAKGQVLVNFLIYKHKTGFTLLLPAELKTQFIKRLQMFVLRADVVFSDKSKELIRIGLSGDNSGNQLPDIINNIPKEAGTIVQNERYCCIYISDKRLRFILIGIAEDITIIWKQLAGDITSVGSRQWKLLDILAGFPWINTSCTEKFLPQMLNLDLFGGINYEKGCYPGQEVIARLHYRGQIKRRLFLANVNPSGMPVAGDCLYVKDKDQSIGNVINVESHPETGCMLLAVVEVKKVETENIYLKSTDGPILSFYPLPYPLNV